MQMNLKGFRVLDFTADNGEQVKGTQLFVAFTDAAVTGQMTDKLFVRPDVSLPPDLKPEETLDVFFNQRGKVEAVIRPASQGKGMPKLEQ